MNIPVQDALLAESYRVENALHWIAYKILRSHAKADEIVQDVRVACLKVHKEVEFPRAWLQMVVRNRALDVKHHEGIMPEVAIQDLDREEVEEIENYIALEGQLEAEDELRVVLKALERHLTPAQLQVFALRKIYGYSQREIAARLHISENTVEQHVTRAVHNLRVHLNRGET